MPLRASSHLGSPNSPSCSALAWCSCWPGLSPWGESWKWTLVAPTAALTRYHYATQPTSSHLMIIYIQWHRHQICDEDIKKIWNCIKPAIVIMLYILWLCYPYSPRFFNDTWLTKYLPQCQWSNPRGYGIHQSGNIILFLRMGDLK